MTATISSIRLTSARDLRGLQLELGLMARAFDPDAVQLHDVPGLFAEIDVVERWAASIRKVALLWQSPECVVEGCTRSTWLEYEHRVDWIETKHTRLDESERMCSHDHFLKTHFGWSLVAGTGKRAFVPPDNPRHPKYRAPPDP